ncbi:Rap1-interacting factor 1 N terminal-domain-containing protein [Nemania sp. FL0031]|nr:Rap1-interacting factor 1 N terminal-domain-containing protein [Nemania sp. FL0031]
MVSPAAAPSAGLDALLARPPTPPRERQNDLDLKLNLNRHGLASHLTLRTPPSHSPDSAFSTNASSRRSGKRVEFTVHAEYHEPPTNTRKNGHRQSTPIPAPSYTGLSKPLKSILKPTSSPNPPNPLDPSAGYGEAGSTITLAAMLESAIKHLAGNDRDSKVDAYTMLVRALKTSTNLPDRIALQSKMSLFMQFIQRDITTKGANGAIDPSMTNHALSLLTTFLLFPAIATAVTSDFAVFIIDHSIRSFEDSATPKEVVRLLMQVVVYQDFPSKVMTADRVGRLVASLHNMEKHIKGKSIIMSRIHVYRKLIKQSPTHMVSHSEWLMDLFMDMLSSLKDIRSGAIALGLEASFTVAKEKQLSKKVMEIFQMTIDETPYAKYYVQKLADMIEEKSEAAAVPRIWSVVILLLRCPIDRWEFFSQWLAIIQQCFNSSDYQTILEANYAWNRLVYALHLYDSSFLKTIGTLCQPFTQLRRKSKHLEELRKVRIEGICYLYYYAFKPILSSDKVDRYWDACVRTLIRTLAFSETDGKQADAQQLPPTDDASQAANILTGLFDSSNVRIWKEDRVAENMPLRPDELPPLDPKWIRRNTTRVFSVVEPILLRLFLDLGNPESSSSKLWKSLVRAVAAAASKEIKVSADAATFLGKALSLFVRIWSAGLEVAAPSVDMQLSFLKASEIYITTMILSIGHLPFTEKLLSINQQNTLVPVATPSHRSGKQHGPARPPLHHLFSILSSLPPGISDGKDLSNLFRAVFGPFIHARSNRGRKELVQELMQISLPDGPVSSGPWIFIAEALAIPADNSQSSYLSTDSTSQSPIGQDFRDIVKHLEKGAGNALNVPWFEWLSLFDFAVGQATELSGEAGCSVAVVEPLAKALFETLATDSNSINSDVYRYAVQLICNARQPRDRQALDAARRRLWGTTVAGVRSASFDPFDNLYRLTSRLLEVSYMTADSITDEALSCLITETSNFFARSNQVLVFKSLVQLQQGLGLWIQDAAERYGSKQRSTVAQAVTLLWDRVCNLFQETTLEQFQLDAIEQLLCCAFKSKHRHIVNNAVLLWNRGFENATEIKYPVTLRDVLLSLRPYVDIALPGLDTSNCDTNTSIPLFIDSQDDLDIVTSSGRLSRISSTPNPPPSGGIETPRSKQTPQSDLNKVQDLQASSRPTSARSTRSSKRNRTPKIRHDDSQIQFATIEEFSPSNRTIESQILTDRQKEVRQRQLENAGLLRSIQSSPENDTERLALTSRQAPTQQPSVTESQTTDRSATPKATRSFDYVSSTPTPRRGQNSIIDEDHEMTDDVPSSPPEPRRNLLPEMKSHSRDTCIIDDMPVTSSPISGSPVSKAPLGPRGEQLGLPVGAISIAMASVSKEEAPTSYGPRVAVARDPLADLKQEAAQDQFAVRPLIQRPETPVNIHTSKAQGTPKSDNEVFVDALTSPGVRGLSSRGALMATVDMIREDESEFKDRSFEMSDGEERSMARLVIELDSRKCDPLPDYDAESPEKAHRDKNTMECITVQTGLEQENGLINNRSNKPSPSATPTYTETDDSQSSTKKSKKRKRGPGGRRSSSGKKHRRDEKDGVDTLMDSQMLLANHELHSVSDTNPVGTSRVTEGDEVQHRSLQGSPDLSYNPGDQSSLEPLDLDSDGMDSDTAAVNLQLITEASQQSEAGDNAHFVDDAPAPSPVASEVEFTTHGDEEMQEVNMSENEPPDNTENSATPQVGLSIVERITASLKDSLEGLRTATLSREDVYMIEGMFMDIKKELYEAERRSR